MELLNPPDTSALRSAKDAQLMVNPWNAMYNDRVGGLGASVGNRAAATGFSGAGGGPMAWKLDEDKFRWEAKYIPGFGNDGNPLQWVESYSPAEIARLDAEVQIEKEKHHQMLEMKKGKIITPLEPVTAADLQAEAKREARCKELEAKLGVDKVQLNSMGLQIDTTAWGVSKQQDAKRANATFSIDRMQGLEGASDARKANAKKK